MKVDIGVGWAIQIDRGPDWVFVRVLAERPLDARQVDLAAHVARVFEQEFGHRLVLELDEVHLDPALVAQLAQLHARITSAGGLIRLCGLSDDDHQVVRASRQGDLFPHYRTRQEAVLGYFPKKPR